MIEETYQTRGYDPLGIEDAFQKLVGTLAGPMSARWRLLAVGRFLRQLDGVESEAQSYLVQVAEYLPLLARQLDPVGLVPEEVIALVHRFERVPSFVPDLEGVERFETAMKELRVAVATLHAYAGDVQAVFETVAGETPAWLASSDGAPLERLEQAAQAAEAHSHPTAATLARLVERWKAALQPVRHSTVVPVVERPVNGHAKAVQVGGLRRLCVELFGERDEADHLRADVQVLGKANGRDEVLKAPVLAARRLLAATYPSLAKRYVAGQVRFDEAEAWHEGRSADLAVAALFYGAVLRFTRQRAQYRLAPDATLTGQLDAEGRVLPVEEEALRTKVRTAFFSWVQCLAVPGPQLASAQAACQELATEHPDHRLDIVGVDHLREVFYDRRLSEYHKAGLARHIARKAWERKFSVGSVALILLLTLAVGKLLYGPIDKNPVIGEFVGEMLVVKNARGQTVEEIPVGKVTVEVSAGHAREYGNGIVDFADINGDGLNEIFWAEWRDEGGNRQYFIHCKSAGVDTFRWSQPLLYDLEFPRKPEVGYDRYFVMSLRADDFDGDGQIEVIANLANETYFPGLVLTFDADTGEEQDRYVHIGRFSTMTAYDLNGDGVQEILLGGTNNAYGRDPALVVLDPRRLSGHGPLRGDYVVEGYEPAREIAYIHIPRTQLGDLVVTNDASIKRLSIDPADKRITVMFEEGGYVDKVRETTLPLYVLPHFNFNLEPLSVGTSSGYDVVEEKMYREGHLLKKADFDYWQAYIASFEYWNGETWQNEPVVRWPDETISAER